MSRMSFESQGQMPRSASREGREQTWLPERVSEIPLPWMLAGLVAVGLGAAALWYFGPDLRRYLKIKSM